MDTIFHWCVSALFHLSDLIGVSYEIINVILFVFLLPGLVFLLTLIIIYLLLKLNKKNKIINGYRNLLK